VCRRRKECVPLNWNILEERLVGVFLEHSVINSCAVELKVGAKGERIYKENSKLQKGAVHVLHQRLIPRRS
jgi:hypothetical protein